MKPERIKKWHEFQIFYEWQPYKGTSEKDIIRYKGAYIKRLQWTAFSAVPCTEAFVFDDMTQLAHMKQQKIISGRDILKGDRYLGAAHPEEVRQIIKDRGCPDGDKVQLAFVQLLERLTAQEPITTRDPILLTIRELENTQSRLPRNVAEYQELRESYDTAIASLNAAVGIVAAKGVPSCENIVKNAFDCAQKQR